MDGSVQESGYSMRLNYKNAKPTGELVEYYNNGKIYRKSMLRNVQIDLSHFSNGFEKYVNSYEIYDYNTGEKIFSESLKNGNGRMLRDTHYNKDGEIDNIIDYTKKKR